MAKNEVAIAQFPTMTTPTLVLPGGQFRVKSQVSRTVLRQESEVPFYVEFQSPIAMSGMDPDNSKYKDPKTGGGVLPDVADVMNLETGEYQVLIINAVLGSELRRNYPDHAYIGRLFGIVQTKSDVDRRYKVYKIIEIERAGTDPATGRTNKVETVAKIDATGQDAIDRAKEIKV